MEYWCMFRVLRKIVDLHVCPPGPQKVCVIGYLDKDERQAWMVLGRRDPGLITRILIEINNQIRIRRMFPRA